MNTPVWNASFSVKVKRCDEDHQKLFALIQQLESSFGVPDARNVTLQVLQELVEYTTNHFSAEEALMEKTNYPGLESHRAQHSTFVAKLDQLERSLDVDAGTTQVAMAEYLKNWLVRHIKLVDRQYSAHLNENGIE